MATENEQILPTGLERYLRLKDEDCDFIFDDGYQPNINSDEISELYYEGYIEVYVKAGTDESKIKDYVHGEAMGLLGDVIQDVHKLGLGCDSFDCRYEVKGVEFGRERVYVE